MCTAVSFITKDHYFGRTLDLELSFGEETVITPRSFSPPGGRRPLGRFALIGTAKVSEGYPLYFDATNEKGLSAAGLNFPYSAHYPPAKDGDEVAPFELIPLLLSNCETVEDAVKLLCGIRLASIEFSKSIPASPLHWLVSDGERSVTVEPLKSGLKVTENPVGVLTNEPAFDYHMANLCCYMGLTAGRPENRLFKGVELAPWSRGMGAMGLPGDLSSPSRFVRAAFTKLNIQSGESEEESVASFFHILGAVQQQKGCCLLGDGSPVYTVYTSCCNTNKGIYYCTTYEDPRICAVDMRREDLDGRKLICYPRSKAPVFERQN